jgi:hypothetical protein
MARQRMIHPALRKDDELAAACSIAARYLFEGLWTIADREGRIPDRPAWIKAELFPYDTVDINQLIQELIDHGCVVRYEADGKKVLWCKKFLDYQNPHHREPDSILPPCPGMAPAQPGPSTAQPGGIRNTESESEYGVGVGTTAKSARADRASKAKDPIHQSAVSVIELYNTTLGCKITPTPANLAAADRSLRESGLQEGAYLAVFEAIRDGTTDHARWCQAKNHAFDYVIRPSYRKGEDRVLGPLAKILNELATSQPKRKRVAGDRTKADIEADNLARLRETLGGDDTAVA